MQVSVESLGNLERRITVQVPKERVNSEIQSRLKSLAGKVRLSGFRPGKVPMAEIKRRYGGQVRREVLGEMMQNSFYEAVNQEKLRPAGYPHIDPKDVDNDQVDLEFTATFEVLPEIKELSVESVSLEKPMVNITDSDVDNMLQTIRKQRITWHTVEREAKEGDRAVIDFDGFIEGVAFEGGSAKEMPIELGSKRMIAGFEEQIVGVKAGEERTLNVTFPDDYHKQDLAGKAAEFKIKTQRVEESRLPELDDEFAQSFGVTEGGLEKFREQVRENMQREVDQRIKGKLKQRVMDALVNSVPLDLPKVLVDNEIEALMNQQRQALGLAESNQNQEVDAQRFEEQARRRVALGLILSEIVKRNALKAEPASIRKTIEQMAANYERPDEVIKYYYSDKQKLSEVENLVLEDAAVEWVVSKARSSETPQSFDELMNPSAG